MDLTTIEHDFTEEESESLQDYIKNGKPGISRAVESDIFKWFELYMSGKTYQEIAKITNSKRDLILYISAKSKWTEKRLAYYSDLSQNIAEKLKQAKVDSLNTVTSIVAALGKYYGDKFNNYIATKDNDIIEDMDTKMLGQYYKSMEILDKIVGGAVRGDKSSNDNPNVNINIGAGAKISQTEDGDIDITDDVAGDMLRFLANRKKKDSEENDWYSTILMLL